MVRAIDSIHIEAYGMGASEYNRAWMQEQLWKVSCWGGRRTTTEN
jgi:hypothetical protein